MDTYHETSDRKISQACFNLRVNAEKGNGVRKSKLSALNYYGKFCVFGNQDGCYKYSLLMSWIPWL